MVVLVHCGMDEQLVSLDGGQKRNILKGGSGSGGVLLITKQHFNLSDVRSSGESSPGGVDGTSDTDRAGLVDVRQQVAAVPMATAPLVDTRTIGKSPTFIGVNTRTCSNGHSNSQHTWDLQIPSRMMQCVWPQWRKTRSQPQQL